MSIKERICRWILGENDKFEKPTLGSDLKETCILKLDKIGNSNKYHKVEILLHTTGFLDFRIESSGNGECFFMCSDVCKIHLIEKDKAIIFERYNRQYYVRFLVIGNDIKCEFVGLIPEDVLIIYNLNDRCLREIDQNFAVCVS